MSSYTNLLTFLAYELDREKYNEAVELLNKFKDTQEEMYLAAIKKNKDISLI